MRGQGWNKYGAKKTACKQGHVHASIKEALRCNELHLLQRAGKIQDLELEPVFHFPINGRHVKMRNGHYLKYTPDFQYRENDKLIVGEVKGFVARDFPIRRAVFEAIYDDRELRVI